MGRADIQPRGVKQRPTPISGGVKRRKRKEKKRKRAIECPSGNYTPQEAGLKVAPPPLRLHRKSESLAGSPAPHLHSRESLAKGQRLH